MDANVGYVKGIRRLNYLDDCQTVGRDLYACPEPDEGVPTIQTIPEAIRQLAGGQT